MAASPSLSVERARMDTSFTFPTERFKGFSDAVFAIAITLLVLKFALPPLPAKPTVQEEAGALLAIWPQYLVYAIGFFMIGTIWLNHSAQFRYVDKITHGIAFANLVLLFFVVLVPLPTAVLERFGITRVAVSAYGLTLTAIAFSFALLRIQVVAAHPSAVLRGQLLNLVLLPAFPIMTLVGYFRPIAGLIGFALLVVVTMLPRTLRLVAATGRSAAESEKRTQTM